jgi:hypothetical protein
VTCVWPEAAVASLDAGSEREEVGSTWPIELWEREEIGLDWSIEPQLC